MNVVYAGYRKWSYQILKNLLRHNCPRWKISGIITTATANKSFTALSLPYFIFDPKAKNKEEFFTFIRKSNPQVCLFYGWSWIIPREIYAQYLCLILHPSPLPKYRGGSPIQHQIINGETTSAATILQAGEKIDAGNIYSQTSFPLDGTLTDVFDQIIKIGTRDTIKVLDSITTKTIQPTPQDESKATFFKRRSPNESELTIKDFQEKSTTQLHNFIRSLANSYPNAYIICKDGGKLYITNARIKKGT